MAPRRHHGRKLLVASIGVATLNYVGVHCGGTTTTSPSADGGPVADSPVGNLAARDTGSQDAIEDFPVANLVAFPDAVEELPVANLVAFPDAGGHDAKE
jgi:hypothetical protein